MLDTRKVYNKAHHVANKLRRKLGCNVTIYILAETVLEDTKYAHLIDNEHYYAFEFEIDMRVTPYVQHQMQYLDRWLERYNIKHNTRFTCLGGTRGCCVS